MRRFAQGREGRRSLVVGMQQGSSYSACCRREEIPDVNVAREGRRICIV